MTARENTRRLFNNDHPERVGLHDSPWGTTLRVDPLRLAVRLGTYAPQPR